MSHVLGFVIQTVMRTYELVCTEQKLALAVTTPFAQLSLLRRYDWNTFAEYLDRTTAHLNDHHITPLMFQRRIIPVLFKTLYGVRFYRRAINPRNLLKMIDTWTGPFLFRSASSEFIDFDTSKVRIKITLHEGLRGNTAFFEHCVAGMMAQLELMRFHESVLSAVNITDRRLDVTFRLESAPEDQPSPPTTTLSAEENLALWLSDFDAEFIAAHSPPELREIVEATEHLRSVSQSLERGRATLLDRLTIISSQVQLAISDGWTTPAAQVRRRHARDICRVILAKN